MKPVLIVKLGATFPDLARSHGDFEDWIARRLGPDVGQVTVHDPCTAELPDPAGFSGVILTGSHAMVTEHRDWSQRTAAWIPAVIRSATPLLGICYGHQLVAHALGGSVDNNPSGRQFGTVWIDKHASAESDPLFADLPERFAAHTCHTQCVLSLPSGAICLAASPMDAHQAYRIGDRTWGVQFHPEFDEIATAAYIDHCADVLRAQGDEPARLKTSVTNTPGSESLLQRFATFAKCVQWGQVLTRAMGSGLDL
jgi:GMP synthase (glutamine-hydrolysing)